MEVSKKIEDSWQTLINWSKELALDIQNARNLRLDEPVQHYAFAKEKRIEAFGKRLDLILSELDQRDFANVKTETLFALALEFGEMLRIDYKPLILVDKKEILDSIGDEGIATWQA